ncbi:MAG: hypothetical protein DDG59_07790 [Anaerolineae bacterium]|jgi:hypothetical protein|nr:MAG: hypothetical protein DDG59_07790 [Anaerolineae bacterium]
MKMDHPKEVIDPIEAMQDLLTSIWSEMCRMYDVDAHVPDLPLIFEQVDLSDACIAAEKILVNLLLEIMEDVGRFSPFYRQPPRAFGVMSYRNPRTQRVEWILAPEGHRRWEMASNKLEWLISQYRGIFRAVILVEGWMMRSTPNDPQVLAYCHCEPPHAIQLKRSLVQKREILCDSCRHPYEMREVLEG